MDAETAKWILLAVAGPMAVVWLLGTRFAYSRASVGRESDEDSALSTRDGSRDEIVRGETELEGDPETVSRRIAEELASTSPDSRGPIVKILERTDRHIRFELLRPSPKGGRTSSVAGTIWLEPAGSRVRVRYEVDLRSWSALARRVNFFVCFVYGGIFVVGAPVLIGLLVVPNEDPVVRYQTFQVFQMLHGVWPPFLLGHVWTRMRDRVVMGLETTIENVRHTG